MFHERRKFRKVKKKFRKRKKLLFRNIKIKGNKLINNKLRTKLQGQWQQQNGIKNSQEWTNINHYGQDKNLKLKNNNINNFIKHCSNKIQTH